MGGSFLAHGTDAPPPSAKPDRFVQATCTPIDSFERGSDSTRFGQLTFLGGCVLGTNSARFGGLSGVEVTDQGSRLVAITDRGVLVRANLVRDGAGRITALTRLRLDTLRTPDGRLLEPSDHHDLEGLALSPTQAFVSSERNHAIMPLIWPAGEGRDGAAPAVGPAIGLPPSLSRLGYNKGLEALALAPASGPLGPVLLAVAEQDPKDPGILPGAYLQEGLWNPFRLRRSDRYDATDAAFLPNGDLLLLERRFNLLDLIGMRLRRFPAETLKSGGVIEGDVLIEANANFQIDNMEGLSVHQDAQGRTILTLVSDNNFNGIQRSLLLEFRLNTR